MCVCLCIAGANLKIEQWSKFASWLKQISLKQFATLRPSFLILLAFYVWYIKENHYVTTFYLVFSLPQKHLQFVIPLITIPKLILLNILPCFRVPLHQKDEREDVGGNILKIAKSSISKWKLNFLLGMSVWNPVITSVPFVISYSTYFYWRLKHENCILKVPKGES